MIRKTRKIKLHNDVVQGEFKSKLIESMQNSLYVYVYDLNISRALRAKFKNFNYVLQISVVKPYTELFYK